MSLASRLRVLVVCVGLEMGVISGVPMRPDEIQDLMLLRRMGKICSHGHIGQFGIFPRRLQIVMFASLYTIYVSVNFLKCRVSDGRQRSAADRAAG